MAHDVFISYSHIDKASADAVCAYLERRDLRCWYAPRDIQPGEDWAESIVNAIRSSRILVLIFTKNSNFSQQVMREINNAVSAGVTVIPMRLEREEPSEGMKYYLSAVHWLDAYDIELRSACERLYKLCRAILGNEPPELSISDGSLPIDGKKPAVHKKSANRIVTAVIIFAAVVIAASGVLIYFTAVRDSGVSIEETQPTYDYEAWLRDEENTVYSPGAFETEFIEPEDIPKLEDDYAVITDGVDYDGEWYYYIGNRTGSLYRMRYDNTGVTRLTDFAVYDFCCYKDHIYYTADDYKTRLNRMKTDGTGIEENIAPRASSLDDFIITGDRIYSYTPRRDGLHSCKTDGSDDKLENSMEYMSFCAIADGYIYYKNRDKYNSLYRAKLNGKGEEMVFDAEVNKASRFGDCIYINSAEPLGVFEYNIKTGKAKQIFDGEHEGLAVCEKGVFSFRKSDAQIYFYSFESGLEASVKSGGYTNSAAGGKVAFGSSGSRYSINYDGRGKVSFDEP